LLRLCGKLTELVRPLVLGRVCVNLHERILGSPGMARAIARRQERAARHQKEPASVHDLYGKDEIANSSACPQLASCPKRVVPKTLSPSRPARSRREQPIQYGGSIPKRSTISPPSPREARRMVDQLTSRSVGARPRIASGIAPWMV